MEKNSTYRALREPQPGRSPRRSVRSPYAPPPTAPVPRSRVARAGATLVQMVAWLAIMAALSLAMLWLLWAVSHR